MIKMAWKQSHNKEKQKACSPEAKNFEGSACLENVKIVRLTAHSPWAWQPFNYFSENPIGKAIYF